MSPVTKKKQNQFKDIKDLSGAQKAAVFVITVGAKTASEMLKSLSETEVEQITLEIAKMRSIKPELVDSVLNYRSDL